MFSTYFGLQLPILLHSSIKLFLLRGWWMSIIPTRHICVLPKLQFCAGNNPGRENRPIKARKESRPFNWILKTFLPGSQHAHMCDLLFHSTIKFLSGTNEICRKRERKKGLMVRAREIGFLLPAVSNCIFVKKEKKNHLLC